MFIKKDKYISEIAINFLKEDGRYTPVAFRKFGVVSCLHNVHEEAIYIPTNRGAKLFRFKQTQKEYKWLTEGQCGIIGDSTSEELIIVEGEWDFFCCYERGFTNSITLSNGAENFPEYIAQELTGKKITIVYDSDEAGKKGALEAARLLYLYDCEVFIADISTILIKGKDVRDFFNNDGSSDMFEKMLKHAPKYVPSIIVEIIEEDNARLEFNYPPIEMAPKVIRNYIKMLSKVTDAPQIYLVASFLAAFSTLIGRSKFVLNGRILNDYYLLHGRSGLTRKSTSQDFAKRIINDVITLRGFSKVIQIGFAGKLYDKTIYPVKTLTGFSVEGVETALVGAGKSILIAPSEYKTILDLDSRQNQQNTVTRLTEFWDCANIHNQLREKEFIAKDYSFSMLSCSTHEWFKGALKASNIAGGFINRHLVFAANPEKEGNYEPQNVPKQEWKEFIEDIAYIFSEYTLIDGEKEIWSISPVEIHFDPHAKKIFIEYQRQLRLEQLKANELEADLFAREETHAAKIAAISSLIDGNDKILESDIVWGISLAQASSLAIKKIASKNIVPSKEKKLLDFIIQKFHKELRPVTRTDISKHFGSHLGDRDERLRIINSLLNKNLIFAVGDGFVPISEKRSN